MSSEVVKVNPSVTPGTTAAAAAHASLWKPVTNLPSLETIGNQSGNNLVANQTNVATLPPATTDVTCTMESLLSLRNNPIPLVWYPGPASPYYRLGHVPFNYTPSFAAATTAPSASTTSPSSVPLIAHRLSLPFSSSASTLNASYPASPAFTNLSSAFGYPNSSLSSSSSSSSSSAPSTSTSTPSLHFTFHSAGSLEAIKLAAGHARDQSEKTSNGHNNGSSPSSPSSPYSRSSSSTPESESSSDSPMSELSSSSSSNSLNASSKSRTSPSAGVNYIFRTRSFQDEYLTEKPVVEKNHHCTFPNCGMSFNRPEHLRRHIRRHTGEKPYKCQICSKGFSRTDTVKLHQSTHTDFQERITPPKKQRIVKKRWVIMKAKPTSKTRPKITPAISTPDSKKDSSSSTTTTNMAVPALGYSYTIPSCPSSTSNPLSQLIPFENTPSSSTSSTNSLITDSSDSVSTENEDQIQADDKKVSNIYQLLN